MRELQDHTRSVPGLLVAPHCAAMDEIFQDLDSITDDLMGSRTVDLNDKTDTARVVLHIGMIQTLFFHLDDLSTSLEYRFREYSYIKTHKRFVLRNS